MMASFKFYSCDADDASPLLHCTFSNLVDLKDQLYYFWLQLFYLLKENYLYYYIYYTYKYTILLCVKL